MKKFIFILTSFLTSIIAEGQQAASYEAAKNAYLDAAAKTKCPDRAKVLREYADWNKCMVDLLASRVSACGYQPTTPIPPCEGDLTGGLDYPSNKQTGNASSESGTISDATFNSAAQTVFNLIDQGKRNKWNKKYLEKADKFYQTYGVTIDAIQNAIEKNDTTAMQAILKKRIDINIDFIDQTETILYYAVKNNNYEITEMLIKAGANVNKGTLETPDFYGGRTPLHAAALKGNLDMTNLLVSNHANVNAQEQFTKNTPMHMAVAQNKLEVIQLLKNSGADLSLENMVEGYSGFNRHFTPYKYAIKLGHEKAARIIEGTERIDYKLSRQKAPRDRFKEYLLDKYSDIDKQLLKVKSITYLRSAPDGTSSPVSALFLESELIGIKKTGEYWEALYNNMHGYVLDNDVIKIGNIPAIKQYNGKPLTANELLLKVISGTYLRAAPEGTSPTISVLFTDTKLIGIKKTGDYWEAEYNNMHGYVKDSDVVLLK